MKKIQRTVFEAEDGSIHETEAACAKHEKQLHDRAARTSYWCVTHSPDLTEGRGYYGCDWLEVYGPQYDQQAFVEDWCHRNRGRRIEFVMGVSPMPGWMVTRIEREMFCGPGSPEAHVGTTVKVGKRLRLIQGPGNKGLIEEPK
jgi:hypothetical protein